MASVSERLLRQQLRSFSSTHLLPGELKKKQRKKRSKPKVATKKAPDATEANLKILLNQGAEQSAGVRKELTLQVSSHPLPPCSRLSGARLQVLKRISKHR